MKILRYAQISLHARLKFLYLYQGYSTARTLLSILRLSEAIARLRWSDEVSTLLQLFPVGVKLFLPRLRNLM